MKKVKKIIVPLLVVLCIPLFLAGCGLKQSPIKDGESKNGSMWLAINKDSKKVGNIFWIKNGKVTYVATQGVNNDLSYFKNKKPQDIINHFKKINYDKAKANKDIINTYESNSLDTSDIFENSNGKTVGEEIKIDCGGNLVLTNPNSSIEIDGKKIYGFDVVDNSTWGDNEDKFLLVPLNLGKVSFDNSKTRKINKLTTDTKEYNDFQNEISENNENASD